MQQYACSFEDSHLCYWEVMEEEGASWWLTEGQLSYQTGPTIDHTLGTGLGRSLSTKTLL